MSVNQPPGANENEGDWEVLASVQKQIQVIEDAIECQSITEAEQESMIKREKVMKDVSESTDVATETRQ